LPADDSTETVSARSVRDAAARTTPDDGGARVRTLLDRFVSPDAASAGAATRYLACVRAVATADDCGPEWLPWFVGDALARTVRADDSPFDDRGARVGLVARVAALAVHHCSQHAAAPDDPADDRQFQRIVVGIRTVERDDRQFFERVVRETATLLDEEYVDSAVLDWQDAFDAA
jgi:hypothetical protein